MPSSISSSEPAPWRRFVRLLIGSAVAGVALVWLFVVTVDPWDRLPLSPPLPRVPISTNARYSFPALAASPRFDAAVFGTSTTRLLPPALLDPLFHAHFANLAMNAATPYEQTQLLAVFARHHTAPRVVMIGIDSLWCQTGPEIADITPRGFPAWMYDGDRWAGYLHMLSLYAVQESVNQLAVMAGLKRRHYGLDGYTVFTPPDDQYDAARARLHFAREGAPDFASGGPVDPARLEFPAMRLLRAAFAALPDATVKIAFFTPYLLEKQGAPGSRTQAVWSECKRRVVDVARGGKNAVVVDFLRATTITREPDNFWDPVHYRVGIAARIARDLAEAAHGGVVPPADGVVLWPDAEADQSLNRAAAQP